MWKISSICAQKSKPRILICNPEPHFRNVLHEYLASVGFHADQARNGQECLMLAPIRYPDVILMDYEMPKMNGEDTLRALRKMGISIPVLLFSKSIRKPLDNDSAVLPKPFRLNELAIILETLLLETKKNKFFIPNRHQVH